MGNRMNTDMKHSRTIEQCAWEVSRVLNTEGAADAGKLSFKYQKEYGYNQNKIQALALQYQKSDTPPYMDREG